MKPDVADGPTDGQGGAERITLAAEMHDLYVPFAEDEAMSSGERNGIRWLYAWASCRVGKIH
jgi:hypothetical protein